ncbi:unnamed protein product [Schistosoma margrebowiei]|uniref:Uncharacterized protein n=1 Tax=Schistosoma margrebowiei TaxID=48269 RepID=A0A183M570_9TREM|nr:unnamed protein product [Schistosoma margrebowiei]
MCLSVRMYVISLNGTVTEFKFVDSYSSPFFSAYQFIKFTFYYIYSVLYIPLLPILLVFQWRIPKISV